jgi:oligoribonuclease
MPQQDSNLVWLDLEMTGLDPFRDHIMEIGTIVTDADLNVVAEGPVIAIHQLDAALAAMDDWNKRHHSGSGLLKRVLLSRYDEQHAERETLDFLQQHVPPGKSPLCGNSICQDRRFLARCMPRLEAYFHYRNLDVSTLKILAQRWAPTVADAFKKDSAHLALEDIRESIAELRHYREHLLRV